MKVGFLSSCLRVFLVLVMSASLVSVAPAREQNAKQQREPVGLRKAIQTLAEEQLDRLGIPKAFFPFLRDDAEVRTGRELFGQPSPDLNGDRGAEVLETDLRYSYTVGQQGQQAVPTVDSEVDTRITVRAGKTGKKLWAKRFDRDAFPFSMRLGKSGDHGVLVISGLWNFFGTTEESVLQFDAYEGRNGKRLWSREYTSRSYYELLTSVWEDGVLVIASFDALEGRADDLMIGLATQVSTLVTSTMATRVVVIDGADGTEHIHPAVDIGIDWWPIPLPTKDLDGDGLEDYATTNRLGIDPGGSQGSPTVGGTVYARRGVDGAAIWTTSGIEMEGFAFPIGLPDVFGDKTPEIALKTYVRKLASPLPLDLPLVGGYNYEDRVYLFEGKFGNELWHKPFDWIYSPGNIDRRGKRDLIIGTYRRFPKKSRTNLHLKAVTGTGGSIWDEHLTWKYEAGPCPEGFCSGGWGLYLDVSPDYQPDRLDDVLAVQQVQQNGVFDDSITWAIDGRDGSKRFQDEDFLQSVDVAVDGRGTDLLAHKLVDNEIRLSVRNGRNQVLWDGVLGAKKLVPRQYWLWGMGFKLLGDSCGDLVLTGGDNDDSFYGVFDGADGRLLWSRWTGAKNERPEFTQRRDKNLYC